MIPDVYFSVAQIPMTAADKTNSAFTIQQLAALRAVEQVPKRQPHTAAEKQIQAIWSCILQVEQNAIGLDNFFPSGRRLYCRDDAYRCCAKT